MSPDESVMPMGLEEALYFQRLWNECGDAREFACRVLSLVMNAVMDEQAQLACGAARGERTQARTNSRNGYRPRTLKTAMGDVELRIPKLREGSYFPEEMLTRWSRVDVSVAALVREMYVSGVSTRKVDNISYNDSRGVTRGIHAEPWDKFISVARGSVFGVWVDLREGSDAFGKVFTTVLDPSKAIYVPHGVGNSFHALEDGTAYTYLVDAHWSLELKRTYTFVNLCSVK